MACMLEKTRKPQRAILLLLGSSLLFFILWALARHLVEPFLFPGYTIIQLIVVGMEIPINYRSRSFKEGKKIRIFRDPLTWIRASVKYRFARIYKDGYER